MTAEIATFLVPRNMRDLGFKDDNYIATFIDLVSHAATSFDINSENEFYYLIGEPQGVTISSEFGVYDLSDSGINKQQHIHQGNITIKNNTKRVMQVKFLQVILKQQ